MKYEEYEKMIVERLAMQNVDVAVLPHINELNTARMTVKPRIYVVFNGSEFAEPENLNIISQVETLQFEIFIWAKKRTGKLGVFQLYDEIHKRLLGYKLPNAKTSIIFNSFGYVTGTQNNWQYTLTLSFTGYIVERCSEVEEPPLIKKITNNITSII